MEPFSVLTGLGIGGLLGWLLQHFFTGSSTTITITNVTCSDGDTKINVSFELSPTGAQVSDILAATYDSTSGTMPTVAEAQSTGSTTSPIVIDYDGSTCADTVVLYAISASNGATGAIPCVSSTCQTGSCGPSSVLP